VLSFGDGIARVYGLDNAQAARMVEFENGTRGNGAQHGDRQIGIVISAPTASKKARPSSATRAKSETPVGKGIARSAWSMRRPIQSTAKGTSQADRGAARRVKAPGIHSRNSVNEPDGDRPQAIDALIPIGRGQRELIIGDRQGPAHGPRLRSTPC